MLHLWWRRVVAIRNATAFAAAYAVPEAIVDATADAIANAIADAIGDASAARKLRSAGLTASSHLVARSLHKLLG